MSRQNIVGIVNVGPGLEAAGEVADTLGQAEIGIRWKRLESQRTNSKDFL